MIPAAAIELERQVLILRNTAAELLNMDMYDRWGHGSNPAMNRKMEQAGAIRAAHSKARAELQNLVNRYRENTPEAVEYWTKAHLQLLQFFSDKVTDATARHVTEQEVAAWQALLAGRQDIVEENVYYVGPDPDLHEKLFGKIEIPNLYA